MSQTRPESLEIKITYQEPNQATGGCESATAVIKRAVRNGAQSIAENAKTILVGRAKALTPGSVPLPRDSKSFQTRVPGDQLVKSTVRVSCQLMAWFGNSYCLLVRNGPRSQSFRATTRIVLAFSAMGLCSIPDRAFDNGSRAFAASGCLVRLLIGYLNFE